VSSGTSFGAAEAAIGVRWRHGASELAGTGFEKKPTSSCLIGGGSFWLTTAGNVIPGQIVEIRIAIWDVGDTAFDGLHYLDEIMGGEQ
jgi:hypothetical protein